MDLPMYSETFLTVKLSKPRKASRPLSSTHKRMSTSRCSPTWRLPIRFMPAILPLTKPRKHSTECINSTWRNGVNSITRSICACSAASVAVLKVEVPLVADEALPVLQVLREDVLGEVEEGVLRHVLQGARLEHVDAGVGEGADRLLRRRLLLETQDVPTFVQDRKSVV